MWFNVIFENLVRNESWIIEEKYSQYEAKLLLISFNNYIKNLKNWYAILICLFYCAKKI